MKKTITVYAMNDCGDIILESEEEHLSRIARDFDEEINSDWSDEFEEYLSTWYSATALFAMDEEERSEALVSFREMYFKNYDSNHCWISEEIEIEIEIEIGG